jgi:hypothetical protein
MMMWSDEYRSGNFQTRCDISKSTADTIQPGQPPKTYLPLNVKPVRKPPPYSFFERTTDIPSIFAS